MSHESEEQSLMRRIEETEQALSNSPPDLETDVRLHTELVRLQSALEKLLKGRRRQEA